MHTKPTRDASEAGFTLIEVLMAMLILAVGLLGLEALGIGAARSVALANRQSQYATLSADSLESALHQLRTGTVPSSFCISLPSGDRLSRSVDLTDRRVPRVTVRAIPDTANRAAPRQPFEISSSLFSPTPISGSASGQPCS